jgi:hypothetical protein
MAIILPLAYIGILLAVGNSRFGTDWRQAALRAALLWMGYLVFLTETLSLFTAITNTALFIGWLIPIVGAGTFLWWCRKNGSRILLPRFARPEGWLDWVLLGGIFFYLGLTALVAYLAPPNTFDSLNYHMARVAHWVQDQSLRHYLTGIDIQNSYSPGAEMTILNVFVLAGSDRFVNFIEWLASAGCIVGASWIAYKLGAQRRGQLLAAVFVATLPMGIAQASSTMNDFVVAFWLICIAAELPTLMDEKKPAALLFEGLAAGLAFLTKPTSAAYLIPFGIWTIISAFRTLGARTALIWGSFAIAAGLLVNLPHLTRNMMVYGNVFDPEMSSTFANELRTWQGTTSVFLKHLSVHAGTPWEKINAGEYFVLNKIHNLLGVAINDPRTTQVGKLRISPPNYNEIRIFNPIHALLAIVSFLVLLFNFRRPDSKTDLLFLANILGLIIFSYFFKWQTFAVRYTLPFFVLFGPIIGYTSCKPRKGTKAIQASIGLLLLILSVPWLFRIEQRPMVDNPAGIALAGKSLLDTPRSDWYFVTAGNQATLKTIAASIEEANCHQVGLVISGSSPEYLYWVALDAPRPDMRIEWITTSAVSQKLKDPSFNPCAVICESCGKDDHFNNLIKVLDNGSQQLFLQP